MSFAVSQRFLLRSDQFGICRIIRITKLCRRCVGALDSCVQSQQSCKSIAKLSILPNTASTNWTTDEDQLSVCACLPHAAALGTTDVKLGNLVANFLAIEPSLVWAKRPGKNDTASANFADGHVNAMILGPDGLEKRSDLLFGVSLMAPHVRYPDHNHAPEETYLVLSDGEFRQGQGAWFSLDVGGSFYNAPGINYAMRSLDTPLFAFWALLVDHKNRM